MAGERLRAATAGDGLQWTFDGVGDRHPKTLLRSITLYRHHDDGPVLTLYSRHKLSFVENVLNERLDRNTIDYLFAEGDARDRSLHTELHALRDTPAGDRESATTAPPHAHLQVLTNGRVDHELMESIAAIIAEFPALGLTSRRQAARCAEYFSAEFVADA